MILQRLKIRLRDAIYFWRNLEISEREDGLYSYWIRIGFKLTKISVMNRKINKWQRPKKCWEWTNCLTMRDGRIYTYEEDDKNILHSFSV